MPVEKEFLVELPNVKLYHSFLIALLLPSGGSVQLGADKYFCLKYIYITLQQFLRPVVKCI